MFHVRSPRQSAGAQPPKVFDPLLLTKHKNRHFVILRPYNKVLAVADEQTRRAASWQTCCKQWWTLSVINL